MAGREGAGRTAVTLECREGYDQHVEWGTHAGSGNWGMVTWPEQFGGRGPDLIRVADLEEEYFRRRAPLRANQNGIFRSARPSWNLAPRSRRRFLPRWRAAK